MTILTLLDAAVLVVGREGFDAIQAVAEQAVLASFQRMRNLRPAFVVLGLCYRCRLMTEQAGLHGPLDMALREGRNGIRLMTGQALFLLALDPVGNVGHGDFGDCLARSIGQGRLVTQSAE
ncbi:MAG: hypothetical protein EDM79_13810 [Chloroflexi bacterium]|nr:MAG: hypothetical protein EDM79_13810 [Chloroflexota bacterium]